jgi:hypothetical protein
MALSIGSATLTSSFATIGTVALVGSWPENRSGGKLNVRLKHTKHASQSGGYPVVRVRYMVPNAAGSEVTSMDSLLDGDIAVASGVATVDACTPEIAVLALTDSAGSVEYDLVIEVPPYKTKLVLQAKQAGDTTNFGTLAAELDGRI